MELVKLAYYDWLSLDYEKYNKLATSVPFVRLLNEAFPSMDWHIAHTSWRNLGLIPSHMRSYLDNMLENPHIDEH